MANKVVPTDLGALTTHAANDYLVITDTSDSGNIKKITTADLFDSPPNNGIALGGASNGWKAAYFTDGTATGVIDFSSHILRIGTTSTYEVALRSNTNKYVGLTIGGHWYPWGLSQNLGQAGTSYGWNAAYFTNGTATGAIKYSSNTLQIGATSNHDMALLANNTAHVVLSTAGHLLPAAATQNLGANSTTTAWKALWLTDGTAKMSVSLSSNNGMINVVTNNLLGFAVNNAPTLWLSTSALYNNTNAALALGKSNNGFSALHLSNDAGGTARGAIKYSTNDLQIGSTSDHGVEILQNNAASIILNTDGRPIFRAPASAIADEALDVVGGEGQLSMYLDETGGSEKLIIKAKLSGGGVKTFTINAD